MIHTTNPVTRKYTLVHVCNWNWEKYQQSSWTDGSEVSYALGCLKRGSKAPNLWVFYTGYRLVKNENPPKNIMLKPLYGELIKIGSLFQNKSYRHIYMERNVSINQFSKMGLQVGEGSWNLWEGVDDNINELDPRPHPSWSFLCWKSIDGILFTCLPILFIVHNLVIVYIFVVHNIVGTC